MIKDEQAELRVEKPEAYEHQDVGPSGVLIFMAGLLVTILLGLLVVWWTYGLYSSQRAAAEPSPLPHPSQIPPEPRVQSAPLVDIQKLRAHEEAVLGTYAWVNRETGIVRIPIDRAMELIAQRGLPYRSGAELGPTVPETGPESGGPQNGVPVPRFNPATPFVSSRPLHAAPQAETQR